MEGFLQEFGVAKDGIVTVFEDNTGDITWSNSER